MAHERARCALEYGWARLTVWTAVSILAVPSLWFRFGPLGAAGAILSLGFLVQSIVRIAAARRMLLDVTAYFCDAEEMEAVGPLIDSLDVWPGRRGDRIRLSLAHLLSQVSADQFPTLSMDQRRSLRSELLYWADTELSLAILHAYEVIGDRFEREVVRMMADGILTRLRETQVQLAAQHCLRQMDPTYHGPLHDELLRPALGPAGTLLRPAGWANGSLVDTLLRPRSADPPNPMRPF